MLRSLLLTILLCSNIYILPAMAEQPLAGSAGVVTLKAIDRELMLRLIELARFNIQFHEEVNHHQWWRSWTYPIAREAGTSLSLANTLTDMSARAQGLNDPARVSRKAVLRGNICGTIGGAVSGTASTLELVQNALVELHAHSLGYSPHTSVVHVLSMVADIDLLRERRAALVEQLTMSKEKRVRALEGLVFHEIEDQLLFEFRKWNCYSREVAWRENVFFAIDAGQNYTSMASGILAVAANEDRQLRGPSGIAALIAGCGATLSPIIASAAGTFIDRYQRRKLSKYFPVKKPILPSDVSMDTINALRSGKTNEEDVDLSHVSLLTSNALILDRALENDVRTIQKLRGVAQQQEFIGPAIGLTSVARATIATDAYYSSDPRKTNQMLFAGRIPQAAGQVSAITITAATKIMSVKKDAELRKRGALPSQIFNARLKKLDALEAVVRSDKF
ncbi:MAG TPA: hypothetical protein V6C69_04155 [Trichormus sp.]